MNPSKIRKKKKNRGIYTKEENKLILYLISQGALTQKDLVLMLYPKEIKKEIIKKDYFICECGEKNFISKKGIWNKCKKCNDRYHICQKSCFCFRKKCGNIVSSPGYFHIHNAKIVIVINVC